MRSADGAESIEPDDTGLRELEAAGVHYIVTLRMHDESQSVLRVTRRAEPLHFPVVNDRAPTEEQALRWLDFCAANAPQKKFFIHCHAGHGRTSTFGILVRIAQGTPVEQAFEEEEIYGFDPAGKHAEQAEFLREFARRSQAGEIDAPRLPQS